MNILKSIFVTLILAASTTYAADAKPAADKAPAAPSKEQREKMAATHEKFATCLKSNSSMDECRQIMMKSCQENMGKGACPMGEMMGGMGHPGMMMDGKDMKAHQEMMKNHGAMMGHGEMMKGKESEANKEAPAKGK
jgi:hypothetical protein